MTNKDILSELEMDFYNIPLKQTTPLVIKYETVVVTTKKEKNISNKNISNKKQNNFSVWKIGNFAIKYSLTSIFIFAILMIGSNYSAYSTIVKSYVFHNSMEKQSKSIINSVEAFNLKLPSNEQIQKVSNPALIQEDISIIKYKKEIDKQDIPLNIEITPYENRLVIPKIGKNIPLLDIKNREIKKENELESIFMKELEKGVIRYPGSALPGEKGNTFIFGHSSNFPWMSGNYNNVFATLNNVVSGDDIIVYYGQKKYTYKVKEKKVITPGDVSVLERDGNKKEISIMTCWPIGTTYQRLIVIGELVE